MANGSISRELGSLEVDIDFGEVRTRMKFLIIEGLP